jgi:hypothetical protein
MKFEYKIKLENGKYNIYYFINGVIDTVEFYGYSLNDSELIIRYGYKEIK